MTIPDLLNYHYVALDKFLEISIAWSFYFIKLGVDVIPRPYIDSTDIFQWRDFNQGLGKLTRASMHITHAFCKAGCLLLHTRPLVSIRRFLTASRYFNTVVFRRFSILKPWVFSVIFGHLGWHGCAKSGSSWFERRVNDGGLSLGAAVIRVMEHRVEAISVELIGPRYAQVFDKVYYGATVV